MKKVAEQENFDIQADLSQSEKNVRDFANLLNKAERHMSNITRKAQQNGGTITYKEAHRGTSLNNQISNTSSQIRQNLEKLSSDFSLLNSTSSTDSSQLAAVEQAMANLENVIAQNSRRTGILAPGQVVNNNLATFIQGKEQAGAITSVPQSVAKGGSIKQSLNFNETTRNLQDIERKVATNVNRLSKQALAANRVVARSQDSGHISYARQQSFKANAKSFFNDVDDQQSLISESINGFRGNIRENEEEILGIQKKRDSSRLSEDELARQNEHISQLNLQNKALSKVIDKLSASQNTLQQSRVSMTKAQTNLKTSTVAGSVTEDADPNSFAGQMKRRSAVMAMFAATTLRDTYSDYVNAGNSLRLNSYNSYGEAFTGQGKSTSFDRVNSNLLAQGLPAGLSGQEVANLAGSYTSYLGTADLSSGIGSLASWARFGGIGVTGATQLTQSAGRLGVIKDSKDIRALSTAFTGSLKQTGLLSQAQLQSKAYLSILNNLQGQRVTRNEAASLGGIVNGLAQQNPRLKGQAGADVVNQVSSGLGQATGNPLLSSLYGANDPKYGGLKGTAKRYEAMQNPWAHIQDTQDFFNNVLDVTGDEELAAQQISNSMGLSMKDAKAVLNASQRGDLAKWAKQHKKTGQKQLNANQRSYQQSGISSLQQQQNYEDQGHNRASTSLDAIRSIVNPLRSNPLVTMLGAGAGMLLQGALSGAISVAGRKAFASLGKSAFGVAIKDILKTPGRLLKNTGLYKGAAGRVATVASHLTSHGEKPLSGILARGGRKIAEAGTRGVSRGLGHFSLRNGLRVGGKLLGRLAPALDIATIAGTGIGAVRNLASGKTKRQNRGMGALSGMAAGAGIGALAGGLPGALAGAGVGALTGIFPGLNEHIGGGIRELWDGVFNPTKAKAATVKGEPQRRQETMNQKATRWIKENKENIDRFNKVIDRIQFLKTNTSEDDVGGGSGDDYSVSGVKGSGEKAIRSMAKKIGKKLGVDPKYIYAQLMLESGNGTSKEALQDNNYGGITWVSSMAGQKGMSKGAARPANEGGNYVHFDSVNDFANYYSNLLGSRYGVSGSNSAADFAHRLKQHGYYTASESSYASMINSLANKYAEGGLVTSKTLGIYNEAGQEARVRLNNSDEDLMKLNQTANYLNQEILPPGVSTRNTNNQATSAIGKVNLTPKFNFVLEHDTDAIKRKINDYVQEKLNSNSRPALDPLLQKSNFYSNEILRG